MVAILVALNLAALIHVVHRARFRKKSEDTENFNYLVTPIDSDDWILVIP